MNKHSEFLPKLWPAVCLIASLSVLIYAGYDHWQRGYEAAARIIWLVTPGVAAVLLALWWLENYIQTHTTDESDVNGRTP